MSESRKAFEVWAKLAFPHMSLLKKGDTDKYVYKTANFACEAFCEGEAWQASRQAVSVPDNWRKAAEGAIDFADSGIAEHYQQTALAHIRGLAGLILSAQVEPREHEPSVTEVLPTNCRERLRKEGKKYPRSGCFSCGNSWLHSGCPNMGGGL